MYSGWMYASLPVAPMSQCPWKETAWTGPTREEVSQRIPILSQTPEHTWITTHWRISCIKFCSRALRLGWETMKRYPRPISGSITIDPSENQTGDPHSQIEEITKYSPRRPNCELWVWFFGWELDGTGADPWNFSSASSTFKLSSKAMLELLGTLWPHLSCIHSEFWSRFYPRPYSQVYKQCLIADHFHFCICLQKQKHIEWKNSDSGM